MYIIVAVIVGIKRQCILNPIIPIVMIATYVHMNVDVNVKNLKSHVAN